MMEMEEMKFRQDGHRRWLYFFLGVFVAASIGLAIALGVTLGKNDDDQSTTITKVIRPDTRNSSEDPCITPSCVHRAGELLQAMDRTADPCDDFYQYACGNWIKTHSIPESEYRYSTFDQIIEKVMLELKGLLEKPYDSAKDSASIRKAKNLYQSCMNEEQLSKLGKEPLKTLVEQLHTWPLMSTGSSNTSVDLESLLVELSLMGLSPLLGVSVRIDDKNSSQNIIMINQLSLSMGRDYLLSGRNSSQVMAFEGLTRQLAVHVLGVTPSSDLDAAISDVVEFEIELAQMSVSVVDSRNTDKYYKKMNISQLSALIPKFDWMKFLSTYFRAANVTITQDTEVVVYAEDYLKSMLNLYETTDNRTVLNYLLLYTVGRYSEFLSQDIRSLQGPLQKILTGVAQAQPRWKVCVNKIGGVDLGMTYKTFGGAFMPLAAGQLYVSSYFPSTSKEKVLELVGYIRESIKQMIREVHWMDAATRTRALEKANAITQKIGYPDYQFSETVMEALYGKVDYQPDTYFKNALHAVRLIVIQSCQKLQSTPNKKDWAISADTVNAVYIPPENSISFPAGLMQPPFFAGDFPASMMFGGYGMVIGHEISHGFDDQGRKYDADGNLKPWWSNSSVQNFEELAKCYVEQYSQQVVAGQHVNGNLTLGENIADNGGIKAAFMAFKKWQSLHGKEPVLPGLGLSHDQVFFLNFGQGWCNLITDEGARNLMLFNPHSPDSVRVRVPLYNSREFAKAFRCPVGSKMNPAKKCALW